MNINSIKSKLLILLFITISCSFLILGFYNAKNEYDAQYNLIKQKELDLSTQTSKFINSYLQAKIDIVEAVASEFPKENLNIHNKKILEKLMLGKKAGDFVDLYIGFEEDGSFLLSDGSFLNIQKDNFDARGRPWYKKALQLNSSGVTAPYVDITTKKLVVTVFTPLRIDGVLVGVVGSDIFLDTVVNSILNVKVGDVGFAYLLDNNGKILIHKDKEVLNTQSTMFARLRTSSDNHFGEAKIDNSEKLISYSKINTTGWYLIVQLDKDVIMEEINKGLIKEVSLYLVLLLVILAIITGALHKVLKPLGSLEEGLNKFFGYLKGEESSAQKLNIDTKDEFGKMAAVIDREIESVSISFEQDRALIDDVKKVVNRVNEGRLDQHVQKTTSNKSLNELKDILNEMIETIGKNVDKDINLILESIENYSRLDFVDKVNNPTGNISQGLNNLSDIINQMLLENKSNGLSLQESSEVLLHNVDTLNRASNDTAVSLEETAAAVEEITSTIANNTDRISQMSSHSEDLSKAIEVGQGLANTTVSSMDEINEQTQSIAEAITVIDQIAFQTNILSLNAAVEAATAGEAGRGFAVVAQEVRNLASRSAEAAKEIKDLVENATDKTNTGKKIADDMIKGYSKLNESIAKTTEAIGDIAQSSKEQKISIEQINDVINRLDQQTQNNAAVATEAHGIATNTANIAQTILDTVNEKEFRGK